MGDIVLSKSVRSNLSALQSTADMISRTQTRLATGKKVNSALDNPSNFFTASSLNSRASDLTNLQDNVANAVKTLEAADNGIKSLTKLVESAQATARQALQSSRTTASFTGSNTTALTGSTTLASLASGGLPANATIAISDGTRTTTLTLGAGTTVDQLVNGINANQGAAVAVNTTGTTAAIAGGAGANVRASLTSDGKLQLEATGATGITIAVDSGANGSTSGATQTALAGLGISGGTYTEGTAGTHATYTQTLATAGTTNSTRTSLASQFNEIRNQITKLAGDSSYNGKNLLNGDSLSVVFNEQGTSTLSVSGVNFAGGSRTRGADGKANSSDDTITGLGVGTSSNSFQTDQDINESLDSLSAALTTLRSQSSTFGSNLSVVQSRQEFTKAMINTLQAGADNLVLADTNEEGANLLALQTRQQLSSTALSLASQADQSVLRLF